MDNPQAGNSNNGKTEAIDARVITPAAGVVTPLYSSNRLLRGEIIEAEAVLAKAQMQLAAAESAAQQKQQAAEGEAQRIIEEARDSADEVRRQAAEEGRQAAGVEVQKLLKRAQEEVERARSVFPQEVQRTAYRFAKAILDVEFEVKPERVVDLVASVLDRARQYQQIQIHLNPEDLPLVEAARKSLEDKLAIATEIRLVPDDELERQGVVIETEMGTYLGSVEEQLRPLREHLRMKPDAEGNGSQGEQA
ncbi:MAG: flagellar biosynthesis/type III secretory pathway protein FliH [Planctomycetota bacterium]|jgi:flagellar biosynthesis/type III secretory pathway protein FliH